MELFEFNGEKDGCDVGEEGAEKGGRCRDVVDHVVLLNDEEEGEEEGDVEREA